MTILFIIKINIILFRKNNMKKEIQPKINEISVKCSTCSQVFNFSSTTEEIKIDVCSNCHPFYTGKMTGGAIAGRIDKFNKKYNKVKTKK